jgi:hypothetical protein
MPVRALYRLRYEVLLFGHCWPPCQHVTAKKTTSMSICHR